MSIETRDILFRIWQFANHFDPKQEYPVLQALGADAKTLYEAANAPESPCARPQSDNIEANQQPVELTKYPASLSKEAQTASMSLHAAPVDAQDGGGSLNPCPFCGGQAFFVPSGESGGDYVECSTSICHASIFRVRQENGTRDTHSLTKRWNCRYSKREIVEAPLPDIGDYVLATKYTDGDPGDAWGVGYYDGMKYGDRHMVKDGCGAQIRHNGFRKVGKITTEYGNWLMSNAAMLEKSPPGMINLWGMLNPTDIEVEGSK